MITFLIISILILNLLEVNGQDVFKVSSTLGSHMVLQRDSEDVVVWGFAKSDSNVTTTFNNQVYVSVTDETGMYFLKNSHSHLYSIDLTFILHNYSLCLYFYSLYYFTRSLSRLLCTRRRYRSILCFDITLTAHLYVTLEQHRSRNDGSLSRLD